MLAMHLAGGDGNLYTLLLLRSQVAPAGMQAAAALKSGSRQVAAGAAAGIEQLAQTAPKFAHEFVEGTLKPVAADVAVQLPNLAEQVGTKLLVEEGESLISATGLFVEGTLKPVAADVAVLSGSSAAKLG
jgi:hypothetical protein